MYVFILCMYLYYVCIYIMYVFILCMYLYYVCIYVMYVFILCMYLYYVCIYIMYVFILCMYLYYVTMYLYFTSTMYCIIAPKWVNYYDLNPEFDEDGRLYALIYDKRDNLDFPIVNFPYLVAYSVILYMSHLFEI